MQICVSYIDISARGPICKAQTNPDRLNLKTSQRTLAVQLDRSSAAPIIKGTVGQTVACSRLRVFILCWVCRDGEHRGSTLSDMYVLVCFMSVCVCLCFVRVFCVLRFFVINVKRWGATGIKLLRWIGSRKWGLGRQGAHYTRTLNSKSQVHHFQPPCKIAHILHVLRILWPNLF